MLSDWGSSTIKILVFPWRLIRLRQRRSMLPWNWTCKWWGKNRVSSATPLCFISHRKYKTKKYEDLIWPHRDASGLKVSNLDCKMVLFNALGQTCWNLILQGPLACPQKFLGWKSDLANRILRLRYRHKIRKFRNLIPSFENLKIRLRFWLRSQKFDSDLDLKLNSTLRRKIDSESEVKIWKFESATLVEIQKFDSGFDLKIWNSITILTLFESSEIRLWC